MGPAGRTLLAWDFDWSLIEENSDTWVIGQLGADEIYRKGREAGMPWTQLMDHTLRVGLGPPGACPAEAWDCQQLRAEAPTQQSAPAAGLRVPMPRPLASPAVSPAGCAEHALNAGARRWRPAWLGLQEAAALLGRTREDVEAALQATPLHPELADLLRAAAAVEGGEAVDIVVLSDANTVRLGACACLCGGWRMRAGQAASSTAWVPTLRASSCHRLCPPFFPGPSGVHRYHPGPPWPAPASGRGAHQPCRVARRCAARGPLPQQAAQLQPTLPGQPVQGQGELLPKRCQHARRRGGHSALPGAGR